MAFNNFNIPASGQMIPSQNQGNFNQMAAPAQQMGGFQPSQPHGVQGFGSHQGQRFSGPPPGYQMGLPMGSQMSQHMGPQMNSHIRPQMGPQIGPQVGSQMGPQMVNVPQSGIQIGGFPSNVQLGHQFPKQQQMRMDQQRKQAEENAKKQQELIKKKQFEAQQLKRQESFTTKRLSNPDALNSLFGKNKNSGSSSIADLIGPLGKESESKTQSKKPSSIFSRPGSSATGQSSIPNQGQWGSGFMTSGNVNPQGSQASSMDDFGDFSQGPSFPSQGGGSNAEFSDFQGAAQPVAQGRGTSFPAMGSGAPAPPNMSGNVNVFSQTQSLHGAIREPSGNIFSSNSATETQHNSFPPAQNMATPLSMHGMLTAAVGAPFATSWVGPSNVAKGSQMPHFGADSNIHGASTQGGHMTQLVGNSAPEMFSNVARNTPSGGTMPQTDTPHNQIGIGNQQGSHLMRNLALGGSIKPQSTMGQYRDETGSQPSNPGAEPKLQRHSTESTQEPAPEAEDTAERKLELLYGVSLPEWCVHGTDLPGIYKQIAEKTSNACDDLIDTNGLFPILMASDLPRDQLGHIWNQANRAVPGQLNMLELRIVLGLVALGQAGLKTERLTLEKLATCKAAPIPSIPEDVLQNKGRGWSFSESLHEESKDSGSLEENISMGHLCSASSSQTIDPNDKYSVFKAVSQPDTSNTAALPSMESKERFGVFQSSESPAVNVKLQGGGVPLFQGVLGWNSGEKFPKDDEFGDFQGQAHQNNSLKQNDFGEFNSKPTLLSMTTELNKNSSQSKEDDFGSFQTGSSQTSLGFNDASMLTPKSMEEDFGDFQTGKQSEIFGTWQESKQQDQQQTAVQEFKNCKGSGNLDSEVKTCEVKEVKLLPTAALSESSESTLSNDDNSLTGMDDSGNFQPCPGLFSNKTGISSGHHGANKLTSSLEKFKLSINSQVSSVGGVKSHSLPGFEDGGRKLTERREQVDNTKQESKGNQSSFVGFPLLVNDPPKTTSLTDKPEDRYGAIRDADFSSGEGIFSVQQPGVVEAASEDDGFADFGGFEVADQFKSGNNDDFGEFKSTNTSQSQSFGVFDNSQLGQQPKTASIENHNQDFGSFNSFGNTNLTKPTPHKDDQDEFGAFGSFVTGVSRESSSRPRSTSNSDSLINSVSLEPTERYKVLSHDSGP
ncbi:synergin gamma-like isoform X2 [Stylophora pistillata]|uniref:synergin gamma-like isoform X2 n=1 Tax=Stylophora pistillata TaxID=50429 RepID=UPI000C054B93|nr:synergin gamma-like isoform X2 [Stylophora pistillata]